MNVIRTILTIPLLVAMDFWPIVGPLLAVGIVLGLLALGFWFGLTWEFPFSGV